MEQPSLDAEKRRWLWLSAALAGGVNGLLGAGGGSVLVPLLIRKCGFEAKSAMASSVFLIFPLSAVSVAIYGFQGHLNLQASLPYLIGGCLGGFLAGRLLKKCSALWLRRIFGILLLVGGIRMVLQ